MSRLVHCAFASEGSLAVTFVMSTKEIQGRPLCFTDAKAGKGPLGSEDHMPLKFAEAQALAAAESAFSAEVADASAWNLEDPAFAWAFSAKAAIPAVTAGIAVA